MAEVNDGRGSIVRRPVFITIDGVSTTLGRFQGLKADMIQYIIITRTSIAITTRDRLRSGEGGDAPGIVSVREHGFFPGREFPAPDYTTSRAGAERPDLRTTVHWEPSLRMEAGKKAVLAFYAADVETEYEVRIEGITDSGEPLVKTAVIKIAR